MIYKTRHVHRICILLAILLLMAGALPADEIVPPYETFPEALGGFYGPFSGSGLHYHRWLGANGFHVSGGIIYIPLGDSAWWFGDTTLDYAVGGEYQRRVYGEAFTQWLAGSLYLFAGAMHRGYIPIELVAEAYEVPDSDPPEWVDPVYAAGDYQAELTIGAGIGIELILFGHFSIPLEFGYGVTWTPTVPDFSDALEVGPNIQTGLRYRY
jgi:hypothetical protein